MYLHFIAIGGAIMHQLAIASKENGNKVTGSDDEINDPARANLKEAGIFPEKIGWFPDKITKDIDVVILGMHARIDNPELVKARELGLKVYSFPEYIYEHSKDKKRVVIAGSHGKTTTTSMVMHVLKHQEMEFDYLVGARLKGFQHSVKLTHAPLIILEGDEYPASAIEKRPKIHFYHPQIAVITGIAWDHINVFPTFDIYWEQFGIFMDQMNDPNHILIYNAQDKEIVHLLETKAPTFRQLPYATPHYHTKDGKVILPTDNGDIELNVFGVHNLQNIEAARKVCNCLGIEDYDFYKAIESFEGAARRLEEVYESDELIIYRDFAHAPSKLKATLSAVREQYPRHDLVACFELHTYSSLNSDFLAQYAGAMDECDEGAVFFSQHALRIKKLPELSPDEIKENFKNSGLRVFTQREDLHEWIENRINERKRPVCLLLMSSGTFDGMNINFREN